MSLFSILTHLNIQTRGEQYFDLNCFSNIESNFGPSSKSVRFENKLLQYFVLFLRSAEILLPFPSPRMTTRKDTYKTYVSIHFCHPHFLLRSSSTQVVFSLFFKTRIENLPI